MIRDINKKKKDKKIDLDRLHNIRLQKDYKQYKHQKEN